MLLTKAKIRAFKSIGTEQLLELTPDVTVLVGMNEAGKTVLLQALEKSDDVLALAKFDPVEDYPRKDLTAYQKRHKTDPEVVTDLRYRLDEAEIAELNEALNTKLKKGFEFGITHLYDNSRRISIQVDEKPALEALAAGATLSADARSAVLKASTLRGIPAALSGVSLTAEDATFKKAVEARIAETKWTNVIEAEVWDWLQERHPKFLYFGDYDLLPSKMNLAELAARVQRAKSDPKQLESKHRAVIALLRMADISVTEFAEATGYESQKAKIEAVSIALTDEILKFWKQNEDLEVEVDIKPDSSDAAPFNSGPNLYLRIKNRRHRGVSTPFQQRSRGFIWFFSFLVWFDSVKHQLDVAEEERDVILLLDEPGLSLHALAQADFLDYIESLGDKHQVVYTTHSPFMVDSANLDQVRVVEDRKDVGTVVSGKLAGSDPRTLFPLQAALGWTIAQNLFIGKRNFLVEGPAELIYFQALGPSLDSAGKERLRDDIVIVPAGGVDKIVTFVALLGANQLKLAVLHDYKGTPDQKITDLVRDKLLGAKAVLTPAHFRSGALQPSDTEDLFEPEEYLDSFNRAYAVELQGKPVSVAELPAGERIILRIEQALESRGTKVRPSGGFNHYLVAMAFARQPPALSTSTLDRFASLFASVNALL